MENFKSALDLNRWSADHGRTRILVAASPEQISLYEAARGGMVGPQPATLAVDADQTIPGERLQNVDLVIVEVDVADQGSMNRLKQLRTSHPHILPVAAIHGTSVALMRTLMHEGVADVIALPLDPVEVMQIVLDAISRLDGNSRQDEDLAPMFAVVRSIGGCGATTIATHLAAELGSRTARARSAVIVDLDLQFGTISDYLGVNPAVRVDDLLAAEDRLDDDLVASVATPVNDKLDLIAAPETILPLESVDTDQLLTVLKLLRRQYDYVVLDLPADWTSWALSAVLESSAILLVVETTLPSLRQAKRRLDLFQSVGVRDADVKIIVNRLEKKLFGTISFADVSRTLGHTVLHGISLDQALVSTAQNQGQLVGAIRRGSRFTTDIAKAAELLLGAESGGVN
jgi:pilus assembly protein CpaE